MPTLYEKFKSEMPTNEQLCALAANEVLQGIDTTTLKLNFSDFFDRLNQAVYDQYLDAQERCGQHVLRERISNDASGLYSDLDSFYMSIFQSRKSRAGSAFEHIIKELFFRLNYPFSGQVNIDGARPDFVLPSEEHFREKPLDSIIFTAKRTLRERWRQVVTEANKGYGFFLATIDKKVTKSQIDQMAVHKVYLVIPKSLKEELEIYREAYNVLSFEEFFVNHLDPAMKRWENARIG